MISEKEKRKLALMELEGKKTKFYKMKKIWFVEAEDMHKAIEKIKRRKCDNSEYTQITFKEYLWEKNGSLL